MGSPPCNDVAGHNACPATITHYTNNKQKTRLLPFHTFIQALYNT